MTRDDIITLGKQAGFTAGDFASFTDLIVHFGMLVAAHERGACAKVCDSLEEQCEKLGLPDEKWPTPSDCAAVIRARGNHAN